MYSFPVSSIGHKVPNMSFNLKSYNSNIRQLHGTRPFQFEKRRSHVLTGQLKINVSGLKLKKKKNQFLNLFHQIKKISEMCPGGNKYKYPRQTNAGLTKLLMVIIPTPVLFVLKS